MNYRKLGKTGLMVSEIGFGGEWLERHDEAESVELLRYANSKGSTSWTAGCRIPNPETSSEKRWKDAGIPGMCRDISVLPGRTDSMCDPGI